MGFVFVVERGSGTMKSMSLLWLLVRYASFTSCCWLRRRACTCRLEGEGEKAVDGADDARRKTTGKDQYIVQMILKKVKTNKEEGA